MYGRVAAGASSKYIERPGIVQRVHSLFLRAIHFRVPWGKLFQPNINYRSSSRLEPISSSLNIYIYIAINRSHKRRIPLTKGAFSSNICRGQRVPLFHDNSNTHTFERQHILKFQGQLFMILIGSHGYACDENEYHDFQH